jgi:TonB family protein
MKRTMFLVVIGFLLLACTLKTKNPKTNKSDTKTKKKDSSQFNSASNVVGVEDGDVNPGKIDTASYIFESNDVEQIPEFPGGEKKLLEFISKHLKYPVIAQDIDLQGKVICRIIVSKTGKIRKPEVVRSLDRVCDNEALRVLNTLPRFKPGKLKGKNVNVWYTIPVIFKLEK